MAERSDALVFFGATGDLAYKKIFPSLQSMVRHGTLDMPVIGVAKQGWNLSQFHERARASLQEHGGGVDPEAFARLCKLLRYVDGDYREVQTYAQLQEQMSSAHRPLYYLAIPPSLFGTVTEGLAHSGGNRGARIILEKPFGRDLASARQLDEELHKFFPETAIFRIDHYLGKEPVQNIVYSRFANTLLESIWDRSFISRVQITMAEKFGVEGRGKLYEEVGAIRDVLQNHMLQLVALLAMEPPSVWAGESLRDERGKLLRSVRALTPGDVVRGQFKGYREEAGVTPDSRVETFAAVRLWIDSWRWAGVPFYIRTGKMMPVTCTEILVDLRRPPQEVFPEAQQGSGNYVRFRLSTEVMVAIGLRTKVPGEGMTGSDVELVAQHYPQGEMEPYERLLTEAMRGEATYFARQDSVEEQWRIVDPILGDATPLHEYEPGTWGPPQAKSLFVGNGEWHRPCEG